MNHRRPDKTALLEVLRMPIHDLWVWNKPGIRRVPGPALLLMTIVVTACSAVPAKYVKQAEPGVTLSAVTGSPRQYRDKIVILGGVLVQEQEKSGQIWLHLKNRPLDPQLHPHRPVSPDGPEAGHFWVTAASREQLPSQYRQWARMMVVGRVIGTTNE